MALYGIPLGTQGTPPHREDILPPLRKVAPDLFRFTIAGIALELREAHVEFREEDGLAFSLTYALPVDPPNPPLFKSEALYLERLGAYHRAALTVVGPKGAILGGEVLNAERKSVVLPLPRNA